jgi:hypothetical protein
MSILNRILEKKSLISLIASNLLILAYVLVDNVPIFEIVLVYWVESCIVGFFTVLKIISSNPTIIKSIKFGGSKATVTDNRWFGPVREFALPFFVIQLVFLVFLIFFAMMFSKTILISNYLFLLIGTAIFFISHAISFLQYAATHCKNSNYYELVIGAEIRALPMSLMVILFPFFVFIPFGKIVLVLLKNILDPTAHLNYHKTAGESELD